MDFASIACKVKGPTHEKNGTPCQDAFKTKIVAGGLVAAIADGHGSTKCKYSDIGAQIATNVFCSLILEHYLEYQDDLESLKDVLVNTREDMLPKRLVSEWVKRVKASHRRNHRPEEYHASLYGTTLLGFLMTDTFYFALQLGDGDMLYVTRDGLTERVLVTEKILGTETHSMSSSNAWHHMVSAIHRTDADVPVLFLLATDGYSNSYPNEEEFLKIAPDYLGLLKEHGHKAVDDNLKSWLEETSGSGSGDDIALVLLYNSARANSGNNA